jgi:hypothetical protein
MDYFETIMKILQPVATLGVTILGGLVAVRWWARFRAQEQYKLDTELTKELHAAFYAAFRVIYTWKGGTMSPEVYRLQMQPEVHDRCIGARGKAELHSLSGIVVELADRLLLCLSAIRQQIEIIESAEEHTQERPRASFGAASREE